MEEWLLSGGILDPKSEFYTSKTHRRLLVVRHNPYQFCVINKYCLAGNMNESSLATEVGGA